MNGWDKPLSGDAGEFPILPAGEYEYTVARAGGAQYKPGPGSEYEEGPQIKLTLDIEGKDTTGRERSVKVFADLFADPKRSWRMMAFAKSAGIWSEGMTPSDILRNAPGSVGRCALRINEWNGRKSNKVERWLPPEEDPQDQPDEVTNANDLPF